MKLAGLAAAVVALVPAAAPSAQPGPWALPRLASPNPLYGIDWTSRTPRLTRVDASTLRPTGPPLAIGPMADSWGFSPDRGQLALGDTQRGYLRIVDLGRFRVTRKIPTLGVPMSIAWLAPRRVIWVEPFQVVAADAKTGRKVGHTYFDGQVLRAARSGDALVLLLGGQREITPSAVLVVGANGAARSVTLPRIRAGFGESPRADEPIQRRLPGLAVDRTGNRAFVVGAGEPMAEVDLATLAVTYHELSRPISFLGRLHAWLEPVAAAKGPLAGPERHAVWLGNGQLAVAGNDREDVVRDGDTEQMVPGAPTGLAIVDTRTWQSRTLVPDATRAAIAGDRLLAFADGLPGRAIGLRIFRPDGTLVAHLFENEPVDGVQALDARVVVSLRHSAAIVDVETGARLGEAAYPLPQLLVADSGGWIGD